MYVIAASTVSTQAHTGVLFELVEKRPPANTFLMFSRARMFWVQWYLLLMCLSSDTISLVYGS